MSWLRKYTIISTYFRHISQNGILRGGVFSNNVTEIIGSPGSGKTLLCYTLIMTTILKTTDDILFIDSGTSFNYDRIFSMSEELSLNRKETEPEFLSRVKSVKVFKPRELMMVLISLIKQLESNKGKQTIRLVIIDCFSSLMNMNRDLSDYATNLEEIYKLMRILNTKFYVGVLVTCAVNTKNQKPRSILPTPWNFCTNVSLYIEQVPVEMKTIDNMKNTYKCHVIDNDYIDEAKSILIKL